MFYNNDKNSEDKDEVLALLDPLQLIKKNKKKNKPGMKAIFYFLSKIT